MDTDIITKVAKDTKSVDFEFDADVSKKYTIKVFCWNMDTLRPNGERFSQEISH